MYLLRRLLPISTDVTERKEQAEASKLVRKFGRKGKAKGQFYMPTGVAITKEGKYLNFVIKNIIGKPYSKGLEPWTCLYFS